jgi:hypothetical protein
VVVSTVIPVVPDAESKMFPDNDTDDAAVVEVPE